jgi:hypothetical protein
MALFSAFASSRLRCSVPVAQLLPGAGQALGDGQVAGPQRPELFEVKGGGVPLRLQFAVLRLKFMPGGNFLGRSGEVSRVLGPKPLPESLQRFATSGGRTPRKQAGQ